MKHKTIKIFENDWEVLKNTADELGMSDTDILIKSILVFMMDLNARIRRGEKLDTEKVKDMLLYWGLIK